MTARSRGSPAGLIWFASVELIAVEGRLVRRASWYRSRDRSRFDDDMAAQWGRTDEAAARR